MRRGGCSAGGWHLFQVGLHLCFQRVTFAALKCTLRNMCMSASLLLGWSASAYSQRYTSEASLHSCLPLRNTLSTFYQQCEVTVLLFVLDIEPLLLRGQRAYVQHASRCTYRNARAGAVLVTLMRAMQFVVALVDATSTAFDTGTLTGGECFASCSCMTPARNADDSLYSFALQHMVEACHHIRSDRFIVAVIEAMKLPSV